MHLESKIMDNEEIAKEIATLELELSEAKDFLSLLQICEREGDTVALQCGVMITEDELLRSIIEVDWDEVPVIVKDENKHILLNARITKGDNGKYVVVDNRNCFSCSKEFKGGDSIKMNKFLAFHIECLEKMTEGLE